MRDAVIALVQLPPPSHGAAAVNQDVVTSAVLNQSFRIVAIPVQLSKSRDDIGDPGPRKLIAILRNAAATATALRRDRPAFAYFALPPHGGGFYANLPLVALVKLSGAPLLYHFHGKGVRAAAKSGLYQRLFAWAMKGAHVILLSERLYDDAADFLAREQVFFLPNALASPPPRVDDVARDGRHILFLSNLIETKGPLVLLDALALLDQRGCVFRASFAGAPYRGLTRTSFEAAIAERRLSGTVRYLGPVVGEAKSDVLLSADILAFPTYNDAFPLVVLEAMGAGLAVVATPEGAIPDMVRDGETGILVPHRDPEKLADALQRLLENPDLCRQMGRRGREIAIREYPSDAFHRRMKEIWDVVIRSRRPP
jgi:glycosyltransferase involved in cell wall biosynthesis